MCRLVIRTPLSDRVADMPAAELDLGVVTHRDRQDGGARVTFESRLSESGRLRGVKVSRPVFFNPLLPSLPTGRMKDRVLRLDECGRGRGGDGLGWRDVLMLLLRTAGARGRVVGRRGWWAGFGGCVGGLDRYGAREEGE